MGACVLSHFSHIWIFAIPWTVTHQAPLSMGFSRQNIGEGCHALLQGIFLNPKSNLLLLFHLHWQVGSLPLAPPRKPGRQNNTPHQDAQFLIPKSYGYASSDNKENLQMWLRILKWKVILYYLSGSNIIRSVYMWQKESRIWEVWWCNIADFEDEKGATS